MNPIPNELLLSFDKYEAMQMAHIEAIETSEINHPDLARQNFERSQAFENLKNQLTSILKNIRKNDTYTLDTALACRTRLALIKKQDELLAKHIARYRNKLKQQKQEIDRGKKALEGYGGFSSTGLPQLLSKPI